MTKIRLHSLVLIALFLSLSCITVVQAVGWVERSDAPCSGSSGEAAFYMFDRPDESDPSAHIVINEIEQNPAGFDDGHEWVELYNPTTSDVNLDGWKLSTMHGKTVTVTLHETIPAKGYFVYTHAKQWLDNEDESVTLRDPQLNEIDRTPYLAEPYRVDNGYYSWQRYPNGNDTDSDSDWMFRALTKGYGSCGELPPETIYVDDDFVDDPPNHKWNTIQEGIDDAYDGTTIIVSDGIYNENVDVDKCLTIRSENGADATIVQAESSSDHVFEVTDDWVTISGFTTTGTEYPCAGIYLCGADRCKVSYNAASTNWNGICLLYSSDNTIIGNNAANNNHDIDLSYSSGNALTNNCGSIHLDYSDNNKITNNTCSNHYTGIDLSSSSNNTLVCNTISNNTHGIYISCSSNNNTLTGNNASNNECGIDLSSSSGNVLTSNSADGNSDYGIRVSGSDKNDYNSSIDATNTVNDKPVYYFFNKNGIVVDELDAGHLTLAYCSECTIKNNTVSNGDGIWLSHSSNNTLTSNTANSNSNYGIYTSFSSNNTLTSNTANSNSNYGIHISFSSNNTLTGNLMSGNRYNFGVSGWDDSYFDNNIDTTNRVNGKPVYYIQDADGVTFNCDTHSDAGTIYCIQCSNIAIEDIALTDNGAGVCFWKTNSSRIENVNASNNEYGICLLDSSNDMLKDNNVSNNQCGIDSYHSGNNTLTSNACFSNRLGILLWGTSNSTINSNMCSNNDDGGIALVLSSSNNTLTDNTCSNNDDGGIALMLHSSNNFLYRNNFINNNGGNAYDLSGCTNFWNSSTEGNYYSDYAGCDNDADGIGDTPHLISMDGIDYFPLMQPWTRDMSQKGDLNHDCQITEADAAIALQMAVRGEQSDDADTNGDGRVSSVDA
ncbi:MAG: NosD domain-containing protein, partial [Euryarchaeota archaeon]|nr:NosD domain-containing protein [Euryarchaeota archaeon]